MKAAFRDGRRAGVYEAVSADATRPTFEERRPTALALGEAAVGAMGVRRSLWLGFRLLFHRQLEDRQ